MSAWFESIIIGIAIYLGFALILFTPVGILAMVKHKSINLVRFGLLQAFFLYLCCLFSVVFLPLPTMEQAANLTYQYQLIPFYFVYDIATKPCVSAVLGEIFNIALTVPFGIMLAYYFKLDAKKVFLLGFALTLFIEVAQLTGLFFIFNGSYRIFDVDDLIANTAGAMLGFAAVKTILKNIPAIENFDIVLGRHSLKTA